MLYYISKLGKNPWAKAIMPLVAVTTPTAYLGYHFLCHNFMRDLLAAELPDGTRDVLSPKLQSVVKQAYEDIKDVFYKPLIEVKGMLDSPPTIKWFATSSLTPIVMGATNVRTGVLIGLPNYYNYNSVEEIPDHAFEVRTMNLFKKSKSEASEKSETAPKLDDLTAESDFEPKIEVSSIDRHSPEGQSYAESMVLSERAKKYSIVRELFVADSSKIYLTSALIFFSCSMPLYVSRKFVNFFKLDRQHIGRRLPIYASSVLLGYLTFIIINNALKQSYMKSIDELAAKLSEDYRLGGIEYFEKFLQRNKAIRDLVNGINPKIDKRGNYTEPMLFYTNMTLEDRLENLKNLANDPVQESANL